MKMAARPIGPGVAGIFFFLVTWTLQTVAYGGEPVPGTVEARKQVTAIASDQLSKVLAEFNHGAALLEKYRYSDAAKSFQSVLQVFPDWTAARFNLGIAYLNGRAKAPDSVVDRARRGLLVPPRAILTRPAAGTCSHSRVRNFVSTETAEVSGLNWIRTSPIAAADWVARAVSSPTWITTVTWTS